jgi:hypothetical protein
LEVATTTTPNHEPTMSAKKKSELVYVIAPLKWKQGHMRLEAETIFGRLTVHDSWTGRWYWSHCTTSAKTEQEARAAAEAWHRERILPALVPANTQGDGT